MFIDEKLCENSDLQISAKSRMIGHLPNHSPHRVIEVFVSHIRSLEIVNSKQMCKISVFLLENLEV